MRSFLGYMLLRKASGILAEDGPTVLAHRARRYARRRLSRLAEIDMPVSIDDVLAAAEVPVPPCGPVPSPARAARLTINWVIAPLGKGSGGHHTICASSGTSRGAATPAISSCTTAGGFKPSARLEC